MTVVLNDPATLADLVRFGPVPHDVEAAARQQLPFENKFRALTAYTENRGGRALVASVKDCERGRGDEPHSERGVDDAGSPWIAKNRRD